MRPGYSESMSAAAAEAPCANAAAPADVHETESKADAKASPASTGVLSVAEAAVSSNLRDIAELAPGYFRPGRFFRSSQFHTPQTRQHLGISAVIDLRRSGKLCNKPARVAQEFLRPDWLFLKAKDMVGDAVAPRCHNCESVLREQCEEHGMAGRACSDCKVYHVDFCTPAFNLSVFAALPRRTAAYVAWQKLTCGDPEGTVAAVVADTSKIGYGKLYIMFMENSKQQIARAFRLLGDAESFPMLVHCVHGKDRTGLLVMLVLRVCGVPFDVILNDYMVSAKAMEVWGEGGPEGLQPHLRTQPVLSVEREYMKVAVQHVVDKYGDVPEYLADCGVEPEVLPAVRANLLISPDQPLLLGPSSMQRAREAGVSAPQE